MVFGFEFSALFVGPEAKFSVSNFLTLSYLNGFMDPLYLRSDFTLVG